MLKFENKPHHPRLLIIIDSWTYIYFTGITITQYSVPNID